jgi:hypothetical protein
LKLAGEFVDLGGDVSTQKLESGNCCQRDERCGNCVFGQFQTTFVFQEFPEHSINPPQAIEGLRLLFSPGSTALLLPGQ